MKKIQLQIVNLCQPPPNPSTTTRATPSARCCSKPWPSTTKPGLSWPARASSTGKATTTAQSPLYAKRFPHTWNAASSPTALPALLWRLRTWPSGGLLLQYPAYGPCQIQGGAPERPRLPPPAGAPVGAVCPQTAALHAARWGNAQHSAAYFSAGHRANAASQQFRCEELKQGSTAHWRNRLHPPLRLQP
jgi:hypothetical protein